LALPVANRPSKPAAIEDEPAAADASTMTPAGNRRMLGFLLAASALIALALAPAAGAAGDPVASGRFDLALSSTFKQQLKAKRVSIRAQGLSVEGGSVDPVSGAGSLKLSGSLKFRHGRSAVVFGKLTATLGPDGALKGSALHRHGAPTRASTTLFQLSGGSLVRDGFGAKISGMQASFGQGAARNLRRKLGIRLRSGFAGSLALQTQPETVEVLGGMATVTQDLSPGGVADKLQAHCINPTLGVAPTAAATQPGGPGTPFQIPVAGGTISPNGWTAGQVNLAGGLDIEVGGTGLPAGCPTSSVATIHLQHFAVNVAHRSVLTDFSVGGPYSPFGAAVISVELQGDTSNATMAADPATHTLTATGAALGLDGASVYVMNTYLPHPSGGPSTNFAVGDTLGTAAMTVQSR
jgi:hypothetical protein